MLYSSKKIGNMELKNRWIMLAMHTGYAVDGGKFGVRDLKFYEARAGGMAAITLVGAVNEIAAQQGMHRLDGERYEEGLKAVCDVIHAGGSKVFMQLFHAGRNSTVEEHNGKVPFCPSSVPSPIYKTVPREMSEQDIQDTITDFADAAERCKKCKVDCIEISLSAGYLLAQFLSPRVNQRNDQWGGNEKRRMRFPNEILKAVRDAVGPDYPVIIKISGGEMIPGGYELNDMVMFINQLPKGIIDGVTVTGGWHEAPVPQISYHVVPGGFAYLAKEIKDKTGLPVIACNRINNPETAEALLQDGQCDFVGAARSFLADPQFAWKAKEGIPYNPCQGCNKGCIERALRAKDVCCAFNPKTGREYLEEPKSIKQKILVVGGGPVGLETACLAAEAGHTVTIVTDGSILGGKLHIADKPPYKRSLSIFAEVKTKELKQLGVRIRLNTPITETIVEEERPDKVIFATGAEAVIPILEGVEAINSMVADDVLSGRAVVKGKHIVIVGGGTVGLETTEYLLEKNRNREVIVVEMNEKVGRDLGGLKWIMMKNLKELGAKILLSTKVIKVDEGNLLVYHDGDKTGQYELLQADTIIFAVGSKSRGSVGMGKYLENEGIPYVVIGDAGDTKNIMDGLITAYTEIHCL